MHWLLRAILAVFLICLPAFADNKCFPSSNSPSSNPYPACCPERFSMGTTSVGDTIFVYYCGRVTDGSELPNSPVYDQYNPKQCLDLCAAIPLCKATAWKRTSNLCYLYDVSPFTNENVVLEHAANTFAMIKSEGQFNHSTPVPCPPGGDCQKEIDDAIKQCEDDRDEYKRKRNKCRTKRDEYKQERDDCRTERGECVTERDDCKTERDGCKQERDNYKKERNDCQTERGKCETELDDCKTERAECEIERDDYKKERDQYKQERDGYKKDLETCRDQLRACPPVDADNDRLNTPDLCPVFDRHEFFLPTPGGGETKWRIYCHHEMVQIPLQGSGYLNSTETPYSVLLASRHWDRGYRGFRWSTDPAHPLYRHGTTFNLRQSDAAEREKHIAIYHRPFSTTHVIMRVDDIPFTESER